MLLVEQRLEECDQAIELLQSRERKLDDKEELWNRETAEWLAKNKIVIEKLDKSDQRRKVFEQTKEELEKRRRDINRQLNHKIKERERTGKQLSKLYHR